MHFWIDKRSQCSYTGQYRVPSSLSSGRGRTRPKGMAAPVHRFTAVSTVECPPPRRHRPRDHHHYSRPPPVAVHGAARRAAEEPAPLPTIASLAAARSVTPDTLLRTAALGLHHSPVMAPHLKFGMLVSFALATIFLAGAKYYFDRQLARGPHAGGGGSGVLCVVVAGAAGVGCALSACRRPAPALPPLPPDRVSSTALRHAAEPPAPRPTPPSPTRPTHPTANATATDASAPPPYHIAVLLPRASPPPAYSALS